MVSLGRRSSSSRMAPRPGTRCSRPGSSAGLRAAERCSSRATTPWCWRCVNRCRQPGAARRRGRSPPAGGAALRPDRRRVAGLECRASDRRARPVAERVRGRSGSGMRPCRHRPLPGVRDRAPWSGGRGCEAAASRFGAGVGAFEPFGSLGLARRCYGDRDIPPALVDRRPRACLRGPQRRSGPRRRRRRRRRPGRDEAQGPGRGAGSRPRDAGEGAPHTGGAGLVTRCNARALKAGSRRSTSRRPRSGKPTASEGCALGRRRGPAGAGRRQPPARVGRVTESRASTTASRHGDVVCHGVMARKRGRAPSIPKMQPSCPRAMVSTGSQRSLRSETVRVVPPLGAERADPTPAVRDRERGHVVLAGEERDGLEGAGVADAWEDELGSEQRKEAVRLTLPPGSGLREILQASESHDALTAAFRDELRQVVQRRDVRQLVEHEQQRSHRRDRRTDRARDRRPGIARRSSRRRLRALIGGGPDFPQKPGDERRSVALMIAAGADIKRSAAVEQLGGIEPATLRRGERGTGPVRREHARCRGPDPTLLAPIGDRESLRARSAPFPNRAVPERPGSHRGRGDRCRQSPGTWAAARARRRGRRWKGGLPPSRSSATPRLDRCPGGRLAPWSRRRGPRRPRSRRRRARGPCDALHARRNRDRTARVEEQDRADAGTAQRMLRPTRRPWSRRRSPVRTRRERSEPRPMRSFPNAEAPAGARPAAEGRRGAA